MNKDIESAVMDKEAQIAELMRLVSEYEYLRDEGDALAWRAAVEAAARRLAEPTADEQAEREAVNEADVALQEAGLLEEGERFAKAIPRLIRRLAATPQGADEPVLWGLQKPDGSVDPDLVGSKADCEFWARAENEAISGWAIVPLYTASSGREALRHGFIVLMGAFCHGISFPSHLEAWREWLQTVAADLPDDDSEGSVVRMIDAARNVTGQMK